MSRARIARILLLVASFCSLEVAPVDASARQLAGPTFAPPEVFGYGDAGDGRLSSTAAMSHWALAEDGHTLWVLSASRGDLRLFELGASGFPEHRFTVDIGLVNVNQLEIADGGKTAYVRTAEGIDVWAQSDPEQPPALVQRVTTSIGDLAVAGDFLFTTPKYGDRAPVRMYERRSADGYLTFADEVSYAVNSHVSLFYRPGDTAIYVNTATAYGFSGRYVTGYHRIEFDAQSGTLGTPTEVAFPVPVEEGTDLHILSGSARPYYAAYGFILLNSSDPSAEVASDRVLSGHTVASVAGSRDERFVYALERGNGQIHIYSVLPDGKLGPEVDVVNDGLWSLEWLRPALDDDFLIGAMPAENRFVVYSRDKQSGLLTLVGTSSGVEYPIWGMRNVSDVAVSSSGDQVWVVSEDYTLTSFARASPQAALRYVGTQIVPNGGAGSNRLMGIRSSPDDRFLYLFWGWPYSSDEKIAVYSIPSVAGLPNLVQSYDWADVPVSIEAFEFSPDWTSLYIGGNRIQVFQRDSASGLLSFVEEHAGRARDIAVSPNGDHVYSVFRGDAMRIWTRNASDGTLVNTAEASGVSANQLSISANGSEAFSSQEQGFAHWRVDSSTGLFADPTEYETGYAVHRMDVAPSGRWVAVSGASGGLWYERSPSGSLLATQSSGAMGTFAAGGRVMVRGGSRADAIRLNTPSDRLFIWKTDSTFWAPPDLSTGIPNVPGEPAPLEFDVYPNPTRGLVSILANDPIKGGASLEVFDLLGRRVLIAAVHPDRGELDLRHLHAGTYFIRLTTGSGVRGTTVSVRR